MASIFHPDDLELQRLIAESRDDPEITPILLDWLEEYQANLNDVYNLFRGPRPHIAGLPQHAVVAWLNRQESYRSVLAGMPLMDIPVEVLTRKFPRGEYTGLEYELRHYPAGRHSYYNSILTTSFDSVETLKKFIFLKHEFWTAHCTKEFKVVLDNEWLDRSIEVIKKSKHPRRKITSIADKVMKQFACTVHLTTRYRTSLQPDIMNYEITQTRTPAQDIWFPERYLKTTRNFSWLGARKDIIEILSGATSAQTPVHPPQ